jgi:tetratricopeptide (TPR) repeat protein
VEDQLYARIEILLRQKRHAEAEKLLNDQLGQHPNDDSLMGLLAEINLMQDKYEPATHLIDAAISIAPYNPFHFYTKARILLDTKQLDAADKTIDQAISMDPDDADFFVVKSQIKLIRKEYDAALKWANHALEIDPENIDALNLRSTTLIKLNRKEESFQTIEGALRENPNNAYTHANYGWGLLEKGDHKKALEHFSEALKNDPSSQHAQAGMIEALKATNPVYRLFLKYAFFMGNLTANNQWIVLFGFVFGVRFLRTMAKTNETLGMYLYPIIVVLTIIAFSTWVIGPISNLFLRFNKYGKHLLDKQEIMSSNFVAGSFAVFLIGTALFALTREEKYLAMTVFGFAMMVPLGSMFTKSKFKNGLVIYAAVMGLVGTAGVATAISTGELSNIFFPIFVLLFVAFQWVANYMTIKENNY